MVGDFTMVMNASFLPDSARRRSSEEVAAAIYGLGVVTRYFLNRIRNLWEARPRPIIQRRILLSPARHLRPKPTAHALARRYINGRILPTRRQSLSPVFHAHCTRATVAYLPSRLSTDLYEVHSYKLLHSSCLEYIWNS